ncbi:MAG: phosphoenolpyruvate--protein phosphotransferase [Lachnospiraceae bacterium]|nr:phosphoenolpyruvate--protein phosphotransferase [Candidatus Colinaster equi]
MSETVIEGFPVSGGIAIGELTIYRPTSLSTNDKIWSKNVTTEIHRFHKARTEARLQFSQMYRKAINEKGSIHSDIINAYLALLDDPEYISQIESLIISQSLCAEYAVASATDSIASAFSAIEDEYMRARSSDISDVGSRLVSILNGYTDEPIVMQRPTILLADDLSPSETLQLDKSKILAFVTKRGSKLSHTAILARSMNIPAIVGVEFSKEINGTMAIVDGYEGKLIINPDEDTITIYREKEFAESERIKHLDNLRALPTVTLDGKSIGLMANIGSAEEAQLSLDCGADGIGLLRTEFLYLNATNYPSEDTQYRIYLDVATKLMDKPVVIRTLDIGADKKAPYMNISKEANPAMGMRGIRLSLGHKASFKTQLKAIMRANRYNNISILIPMIISLEEVWQVKELIQKVENELIISHTEYNPCKLGIMIETPAAACICDKLVEEVDFISIGTNDLTQYLLAVDRQNTSLEFICDYHHEAVLRTLEHIIKCAHGAGKHVCICGEMAADTTITQHLLSIGVDELSVAPSALLSTRESIRNSKVNL